MSGWRSSLLEPSPKRWPRTRCARRTAAPGVGLEAPQLEPSGRCVLGEVDQAATDAVPDPGRARCTAGRPRSPTGDEPDDAVVAGRPRPTRRGSGPSPRPATGGRRRRDGPAGSRTSRARREPDVAERGTVGRGRRSDRRSARASVTVAGARPPPRRGATWPGRGRRAVPASVARRRRRPGLLATTSALAAPVDDDEDVASDTHDAGRIVTRSTCGSMWVGAGMAIVQADASKAGEPGKTDRMWPSPPMPEDDEVEDGHGRRARSSPACGERLAMRVAAHAGPSLRPMASAFGNGCRFATGGRSSWCGPPGGAERRTLLGRADVHDDVVERLDVGQRVVARHEAIVAPPRVDLRPRGSPGASGSPRWRYIAGALDPPVVAQCATPRASTGRPEAAATMEGSAVGGIVRPWAR